MNEHVNLMAEQYEFGAYKEGDFIIFNKESLRMFKVAFSSGKLT